MSKGVTYYSIEMTFKAMGLDEMNMGVSVAREVNRGQ